ncbi:MAG: hypothetical protein SNJ80_15610 [Anaerolinea sp.]
MKLSLEQATFLILMALLVAVATRVPVDTDTWWHLRSGEYTLTQGMIYTDPFSHTFQGQKWVNHSWGAQLVLYGAYRLLGNVGLSLYTTLLAVWGIAVLYPVMRGPALLRAFVLVLAAATASVFWSARPQMASFFLSAVFLAVLYHYTHTPTRRIWWLVPLMALWANLHAGYSIGFIFMGAFVAGMALNRLGRVETAYTLHDVGVLALVAAACVPMLLLTPYGLDTLLVPFETVGIGALRQFVQEWNSPNFQQPATWPIIAMVVVSLGAAWLSRSKWDWVSFFLWGGTLFMALLYGRNFAVFAVAAAPVLSFWIDDALRARGWTLRPRPTTARRSRLNWALVIMVWAGVLLYVVGAVWPARVIREAQRALLPVDAVAWLNEQTLNGNLFNSYNWGGYLIFAAPEQPVFIDGRTDLYGEFVRQYVQMANALGRWRDLMDEYDIGTVLIETNSSLDAALRREPGWMVAYEDRVAAIHIREEAAP